MKKFLFALLAFASSHLLCDDIVWTPSVELSSAMANSSAPSIGIDINGNAEAVWVQDGFLASSSLLYGGTWSEPEILSNSGASVPSLVVDGNGNTTVIWLEGSSLLAKTKPAGDVWGSETTLSSSNPLEPELAVDSSGNIIAIWTEAGIVKSKTKLFGGSWQSSPDTLSSSGADSPQIAIGSDGTAVAAWHILSGGIDRIYSSHKALAGAWSAGTQISNVANNSVNPKVAVDSSGNALAVWYIYSLSGGAFSDVYLQSSRKPVGGSWSLPILVSDMPGYYDPSRLTARIAYDSTDTAIAAWTNSPEGSKFLLYTTVLETGGNGTWYSPPADVAELEASPEGYDLSVTNALSAFLAYMVSNGSNIAIYSSNSNISAYQKNQWSFPNFLSLDWIDGFPRIASSVNGEDVYAAAVWIRNGETISVQAATGEGTLIQPPTNLSVVQNSNNFGIFTEYYNTISWTPSSSPDIFLYLIFRNGLYIGSASSTDTSFIDNNQQQNGPVTYGIASFDSKGTQSGVATVSFP